MSNGSTVKGSKLLIARLIRASNFCIFSSSSLVTGFFLPSSSLIQERDLYIKLTFLGSLGSPGFSFIVNMDSYYHSL